LIGALKAVAGDGEAALFWSAAILLVAALLLGGASRGAPLRWLVVELSGLGAGCIALVQGAGKKPTPLAWAAVVLLGLLFAIPIAQLTPLPPPVWTALTGRGPLAHAISLIGLPQGWRPMSLAPDETARAGLYLIAPAGMFLAAFQLSGRRRGHLVAILVGVALVSLIVGAVQAAGGDAGRFRLYDAAVPGLPNGFFANRNHQAALMVACVLFAAAAFRREGRAGAGVQPAARLGLMLLFAVGAAATLSRAGVLLLAPALLGGLLMLRPASWRPGALAPVIAVCAAVIAVVILVAILKGGVILDRFMATTDEGGGRLDLLPPILRLGQGLQPWGGGLGAFDLLYRASEPLEQIDPFYLNHVHDDYVEAWLEGGWPAVVLMLGFGAWWSVAAWSCWSAPPAPGSALARAGSLTSLLLLLHSGVDYPLRTPALAVVFALACALMLDPPRPRSAETSEP